MSTREALLEKVESRRVVAVDFLGHKINCVLHTLKSIEDLQEKLGNDEKKAGEVLLGFIPLQFLDPEDGKPIFTEEYLRESMSNKDMNTLVTLFFKTNGDVGIEEREKN